MIDERYSVVFDYLTKGGKPTVLQAPPALMSYASGYGATKTSSSLVEGAVSGIIVTLISALTGGIIKGFAKSKTLTLPKSKDKNPFTQENLKQYSGSMNRENNPFIKKPERKKVLGVQTAKVFTDKSQIRADLQAMNERKALRNDLKATALKLDATQKMLQEAESNLKVANTVKKIERQENIARMELVKKLSMSNDFSVVMKDLKGKNLLQDVVDKSSKIDYKLPPATIQFPVKPVQQISMQRAAEPLTGYDNAAANLRIQKQTGLNEVNP